MQPTKRLLFAILIASLLPFITASAHPSFKNVEKSSAIEFGLDCPAKLAGGEKGECKLYVLTSSPDELVFRIKNSNTTLVQVESHEVRLAPNTKSTAVRFISSATPIKNVVSLTASLDAQEGLQKQANIEFVPAIIRGITMATNSMFGTHGAKIRCRVDLKTPAPPGGIELYVNDIRISPSPVQPVGLEMENPRVPSGSRAVEFDFEYERLLYDGGKVADGGADFNYQTRRIELIVSLDPQDRHEFQTIAGTAQLVRFDVQPLKVSTISFQPQSVVGGAEALANVTLNATAGPGEIVRLSPYRSPSNPVWVVPVGSSCQDSGHPGVTLTLTQATSTFNFKVCTASTPNTLTSTLVVSLRSGDFPVSFTVQRN